MPFKRNANKHGLQIRAIGLKHMKNLKNKLSYIAVFFVLYSCKPNPKIYFNIKTQEIVECDGKGINEFWFQNDSINPKGLSVEDDIIISWKNENHPPNSLLLNKIPKGYFINGKSVNNLILMKNTSYTVMIHYFDSGYFKIRIWTNKEGKVYKTSHFKCSNLTSL